MRPEDIDLFLGDRPPRSDARNVVAGRVKRLLPTETHFRVEIDCGERVVAVVSRARVREMALEAGGPVYATFALRAAHLIKRVRD